MHCEGISSCGLKVLQAFIPGENKVLILTFCRSGPYFSVFVLKMKNHRVIMFKPNTRKSGPEKTPYFGYFSCSGYRFSFHF